MPICFKHVTMACHHLHALATTLHMKTLISALRFYKIQLIQQSECKRLLLCKETFAIRDPDTPTTP